MHRDVQIPDTVKPVKIVVKYGFASRGVAHAWIYDKDGQNPSDKNFDYAVDPDGSQVFTLPVDTSTVKTERRFVYLLARVTSQAPPPAPVRAIAQATQDGNTLGDPMAMSASVTPDQQTAEFEFTFQFQ